jgi:hypothetical protein
MTPIWSPEAVADLVALRAYVEQDNPAAAQRVALHIMRGEVARARLKVVNAKFVSGGLANRLVQHGPASKRNPPLGGIGACARWRITPTGRAFARARVASPPYSLL